MNTTVKELTQHHEAELEKAVEEIIEEFRNKILDVETAIRLTYNEKDSDAMVAKMLDFITSLIAKHDADIESFKDKIATSYEQGVSDERDRIEGIFKRFVPPHALSLEDSVWLKRLLNKAFHEKGIFLTPTNPDKQKEVWVQTVERAKELQHI